MDRLSVVQRSRLMSRIRSKDTKPEMIVRTALHRLGFRYVLHRRDMPGTPDLVFPARGKVLFVNGCFWHRHSCKFGKAQPKSNVEFWDSKIAGNVRRDNLNITALRRQGWRVMVIWECRIKRGAWLDPVLKFLNR
jgi:DNA mismatch endonuclease (patch repair protein)